MKKFKDFEKQDDTDDAPSKENLVNIIANSLNRMSSKDDQKGVLMLIAALGLITASSDSSLGMSVARKLANIRK